MRIYIVLKSTTFYRCSASSGGAIYAASSNVQLNLIAVIFINNTALEDGGAIYLRDSNDDNMTLSGVYFESNLAGYNGGALSSLDFNTGMKIIQCSFIANVASSGGNDILHCVFFRCIG